MTTQLSRRKYAVLSIVLAAAVFLGLNIAVDATITTAKIDLTDTGRYTLSQGTRNVIKSLSEPVTLRFFFSKKAASQYAQTRAYAGRVRDLLREYAARSHGKIILEEVDPEPFTPTEDEAGAAGITAVPTESGESVYFGLVGVNRIDGREVIPYFSPEREGLLEYDLTTLIYRLSTPKKYKIAILSGLPLETGPGGMQAMMSGRHDQYNAIVSIKPGYVFYSPDPGGTKDFSPLPARMSVRVKDAGALRSTEPSSQPDAAAVTVGVTEPVPVDA